MENVDDRQGEGGTAGGGDGDRNVEDLRQRVEELTALLNSRSNVVVMAPPPRLKIFTGLPPKGSQEEDFGEWVEAIESLPEGEDSLRRVRQSLRGVAFHQVRCEGTVRGIVEKLKEVYGEARTPSDLFLDFCGMKPEKGESNSTFLCRLWGQMTKINEKNALFTQGEADKRVFHILNKNVATSISLELRTTHGFPGEAAPDPAEVLKTLKRLEGGEVKAPNPSKTANCMPQVEAPPTLNDATLERIADMVVKKLAARTPPPHPGGSTKPRGPPRCYKCGELGHIKRNCPRTDPKANGPP